MESQVSDYDANLDKWKLLVGGFILSFGDIEMITYRLWRELYEDREFPKQFSDRTGKLIGKLAEEENKNKTLIELLKKANKLSIKRHTIAHNPMAVQVFEHTPTGRILTELAIFSPVNEDYIDDLELEELVAEAENLVSDLFVAVGYVAKEPKPI